MRQREKALIDSKDMLALNRDLNQPDVQSLASADDFGTVLRDKSLQQFGHLYVAGWAVRNLRMVANIQSSYRTKPGARVLSIVGAGHTVWIESIVGMGQGVAIVDVQQA